VVQATDGAELHGPIDFVLIEFPGDRITGEAAAEVIRLSDAGIIRLWDAVIIGKDADGTVRGIEISDLDPESAGGFTAVAGSRSGLVDDSDIAEAGAALEPGTFAALLVYENAWAVPFITAAYRNGGQVVASARIPADVVNAALDALDQD
jgi:uncharacterized membrane protein